jgi:diacylglycerol kinase family enzyme
VDKLGWMLAEHSSSQAATADDRGRLHFAPLFVVINTGSGAHDAARTQQLLSGIFQQAGREAQFAQVTKAAAVVRACDEAARQAAHHGGVLVAAGGDGTINTAAQAAIAHGCPLGVIPQGTFNFLARDHGIPLDAEAAARALLEARPTAVQVGDLNGTVFLVNASLGLYPQLLQDREAFKTRLGRRRWVALLAGLATLFQWRRQLSLVVELEGNTTLLTTPTLFVGNNRLQVERVGIDDEVTGRMGRGRLAGVALRPIGTWAMLGLVLRGALGRLGEADQVVSFSFHTLDVTVLGMRRVKVATDGEVKRMAPPLRFSVGPQPLRLMLPAPEARAPRE